MTTRNIHQTNSQSLDGVFIAQAERTADPGSDLLDTVGLRQLVVYFDVSAVGRPVTSTAVGAGGSGYTAATALYDDGQGHTDTGTVTLTGDAVSAVAPDHAATVYTATPTVTITGDGTLATATATLAAVTNHLNLNIYGKNPIGNARALLTSANISTINAGDAPRIFQVNPFIPASANQVAQMPVPHQLYVGVAHSGTTNTFIYRVDYELLP